MPSRINNSGITFIYFRSLRLLTISTSNFLNGYFLLSTTFFLICEAIEVKALDFSVKTPLLILWQSTNAQCWTNKIKPVKHPKDKYSEIPTFRERLGLRDNR